MEVTLATHPFKRATDREQAGAVPCEQFRPKALENGQAKLKFSNAAACCCAMLRSEMAPLGGIARFGYISQLATGSVALRSLYM